MERRHFIKSGLLVSSGVLITGNLAAQSRNKAEKLVILHTNDTHSNLDAFPANHAKFPDMGGVSKRYSILENIRKEEEHVLLLDAGDIFQGTPYFNKFGGVLEMKVMSKMGYDAATMGNHDFDAGLDGFLKAKEFANFPFVCANYDFSNTVLATHIPQHTIIQKGNIKVGVFGIGVALDGLVPRDKYGETEYLDPILTANKTAAYLKKQKCDLIICLSHLGFEYASAKVSDKVLAEKTKNIHLIIGGHTHTFLEKPVEVANLEGKTVLINQVGWGGVQMGRLDFIFGSSPIFQKKDVVKIQ